MTTISGGSAPARDGLIQTSDSTRAHQRLTWLCLMIAATGTPSTVAVIICGDGAAAAAGATAIGTITVAAFTAARAFLRQSGSSS